MADGEAPGVPKWVWIAAIIGVIVVLFLAHKNASAATGGIIAAPVDPNAAAIAEGEQAAALGGFQALAGAVTAIDTNANTNAAQTEQSGQVNQTARILGGLQLKATEDTNSTTLSVAKVQANAATQQTVAKSSAGVIGAIASVLAIFGL